MPMQFSPQEIIETIRMVQMEKLDIRTITMGISLRDCSHPELKVAANKAYDKICRVAGRLVAVGDEIEREFGIPIVNKRISVTPIALVAESSSDELYVLFAQALDRAAREVGVNFLGGFSALVQKGMTKGDRALIASIPQALSETERVCASVNIGSTRASTTSSRRRHASRASSRSPRTSSLRSTGSVLVVSSRPRTAGPRCCRGAVRCSST